MSKYIIPTRGKPKSKTQKIQTKLKKDKVVLDYEEDELNYLSSPLGKANYEHNLAQSQHDGVLLSDSSEYESEDEYEDASSESEEAKPNKISSNLLDNEAPKPRRKAHWSDRIKCQICGGEYARSGVSSHRGTKRHQIYEKANKKFLSIMRGEE